MRHNKTNTIVSTKIRKRIGWGPACPGHPHKRDLVTSCNLLCRHSSMSFDPAGFISEFDLDEFDQLNRDILIVLGEHLGLNVKRAMRKA